LNDLNDHCIDSDNNEPTHTFKAQKLHSAKSLQKRTEKKLTTLLQFDTRVTACN